MRRTFSSGSGEALLLFSPPFSLDLIAPEATRRRNTRPPTPLASCAVAALGGSGNTTGGSGNSSGGCVERVAAGPLASGVRCNTAVAIGVTAAAGLVVVICSRRIRPVLC